MLSFYILPKQVRNRVIHANNMDVLPQMPDGVFNLIYIDPPFNTGKKQIRTSLTVKASEDGTRKGFNGKNYEVKKGKTLFYVNASRKPLGL